MKVTEEDFLLGVVDPREKWKVERKKKVEKKVGRSGNASADWTRLYYPLVPFLFPFVAKIQSPLPTPNNQLRQGLHALISLSLQAPFLLPGACCLRSTPRAPQNFCFFFWTASCLENRRGTALSSIA